MPKGKGLWTDYYHWSDLQTTLKGTSTRELYSLFADRQKKKKFKLWHINYFDINFVQFTLADDAVEIFPIRFSYCSDVRHTYSIGMMEGHLSFFFFHSQSCRDSLDYPHCLQGGTCIAYKTSTKHNMF